MDNKKDEKVIRKKDRINKIDNDLDNEKIKLNKLDEMQEEIVSLNKNLNKCIDLLSKSIKGSHVDNIFEDMSNANRISMAKWTVILEEEVAKSKKSINELYKEKDKIIKEKDK